MLKIARKGKVTRKELKNTLSLPYTVADTILNSIFARFDNILILICYFFIALRIPLILNRVAP